MEERVEVFIACSGRAKNIAQYLNNRLSDIYFEGITIKPTVWWNRKGSISFIIEKLIKKTRECDFAVILLTKDDITFEENDGGKREIVPRDNCVFEAGLFTGALGPDFKRCFLLSSVEQTALPTDLQGLVYIKISEYNGKNNNQEAKDSLEEAANAIGIAISDFKDNPGLHVNRGLKRPLISASKLQELESLKSRGGNLIKGSTVVFVRSPQPLEVEEEFAKQVITNMVNGPITYKYVFDKDKNTLGVIADLIAELVGVTTIKINKKGVDIDTQRAPSDNIKTIQNQLRIYFLPDKPGIHYCIHNANRDPNAICYLKCPDSDNGTNTLFIEWCRDDKAIQISQEVGRLCIDPPKLVKRVFNSSIHCDLYDDKNQDFLSDLGTELDEKLTPYGLAFTQIKSIFFGKNTVINQPVNNIQVGQATGSTQEEKYFKAQNPEFVSPEHTIRIFLASSSELQKDRDDFDLYFRQQNDKLRKRGVYLEIIRWENFLDAMADNRLQDEYNKEVKACDIFVSLFFSRTGKYTEEEFDAAHKQFLETKKPLIYTFFKNAPLNSDKIGDEIISLLNFKKKLVRLGHFHTSYDNIEHLKQQFRDQLDKLLEKGI